MIFRPLIILRRAVLAFLMLIVFCPPAFSAETITVSGTGTALGAMRRIIVAFERTHPALRIKVLPSVGSAGAIKAVAKGSLDIGLNGRSLLPQERSLAVRSIDYARTPFVFAVNQSVSEESVSPGDVIRMFRGELQTWKSGERVRVILRPAGDADTLIAKAISPELSAAVDEALGRDGMMMAATNQECHEMLARTPGGIGFSTVTQIMMDSHSNLLKALAWNGVEPTLRNLSSGAYPLVKTLSFIVRPDPAPPVRAFLRFVASPEGRRILEATGHVPVTMQGL